ncbi:N-acetylneuraminate lyase [Phyllobacterium sp. SB3]|uniref:N-acetylneuraminate lyase n=1 Tax=Phyllobacterium sp. SB3 TaxID=3156073 RepID=UPI0032AF90A0
MTRLEYTNFHPKLAGLHAALMTPYDQNEEVSETCLRRLIEFIFQQGVSGLYVGGSTGEALLQSTSEREKVLNIAAEASKGRGALIGQVGSIGSREARYLAKVCAKAGFDAVSAIPPIYFTHSKKGILSYYESIIDAADGLPLIIYNIPAMSGVRFTANDLKELLQLSGVIGIKQTAIDMYQMEQLRRAHPQMLLLNGYDEMMLAGLASGANGGVGSTYNIMGGRYVDLVNRFHAGDHKEALTIQSKCNMVIDELVTYGVFPALKYLLYRMGVIATPICRAPLDKIEGKAAQRLDEIAIELATQGAGA